MKKLLRRLFRIGDDGASDDEGPLPVIEIFPYGEVGASFGFHLVGANHEIQVVSEGYTSRFDAERGVGDAKRNMAIASIVHTNKRRRRGTSKAG